MSEATTQAGVFRTLAETPPAARFLLLGAFINQLAAFVQLFMVLYLTERGFSEQQAGLALGAYSVGAVLGVLFGGAFSDRLGPARTITFGMGLAAVFTLAVTALDNFPAIVVAVALSGALTQAARPAVSAMLLGLVPQARQVMVFAVYTTALNLGGTLGPLGAVWLSTISWNLVFWADAATALLYALIALFLLPQRKLGAAADAKPADEEQPAPKGVYLAVLRDQRYVAYLSLMLANGLVHVQFFAVLPLMLKSDGYDAWAYGALTAFDAFLAISCQLLVTRTTQRWPSWVAIIVGWIMLVVGFGLFGLPGGLAVLFVGVLIAVLGQITGGPAAFSYPAKAAPPGAVGQYIGAAHALFGLGYAVGPILGILLWNSLGHGFWALVPALGLVMIFPGVWGLRPVPGTEAEQPQVQDEGPAEAASVEGPAGEVTVGEITESEVRAPDASTGSETTRTTRTTS